LKEWGILVLWSGELEWGFGMGIWNGNLEWEFGMGIWNGNLEWEFGMGIWNGEFVAFGKCHVF